MNNNSCPDGYDINERYSIYLVSLCHVRPKVLYFHSDLFFLFKVLAFCTAALRLMCLTTTTDRVAKPGISADFCTTLIWET